MRFCCRTNTGTSLAVGRGRSGGVLPCGRFVGPAGLFRRHRRVGPSNGHPRRNDRPRSASGDVSLAASTAPLVRRQSRQGARVPSGTIGGRRSRMAARRSPSIRDRLSSSSDTTGTRKSARSPSWVHNRTRVTDPPVMRQAFTDATEARCRASDKHLESAACSRAGQLYSRRMSATTARDAVACISCRVSIRREATSAILTE
jgi:hypothetical protein